MSHHQCLARQKPVLDKRTSNPCWFVWVTMLRFVLNWFINLRMDMICHWTHLGSHILEIWSQKALLVAWQHAKVDLTVRPVQAKCVKRRMKGHLPYTEHTKCDIRAHPSQGLEFHSHISFMTSTYYGFNIWRINANWIEAKLSSTQEPSKYPWVLFQWEKREKLPGARLSYTQCLK